MWQDNYSDLIVTEWAAGGKSHYRMADRLAASSFLPQPKHGTPLAAAASDAGVVHVFFVDTQGAMTHMLESAAGSWESGSAATTASGPLVPADFSPLSAAWHRGTEQTRLLAVAYETPQQELRLAVNDGSEGDGGWQTLDVTSLAHPVPGQTDEASFALAGNWRGRMLLAVQSGDGLGGWECAVGSEPRCSKANDTLQGEHTGGGGCADGR